MTLPYVIMALVTLQRLGELVISARNTRKLRAAGAIESVAVVLQLYKGFLHPSANSEDVHPEIAAFAAKIPQHCLEVPQLRTIAKAGFGFGDVNSCIIFKKWEEGSLPED